MIIKVCGMREPENIRAVERLGVDWMGFIFYPRSPRYVAARPSYLPSACRRVGVFVNSSVEDILLTVKSFGLDYIQLHGSESPAFCAELKSAANSGIIKAFSIASADDFRRTAQYESSCDYFLFDTACAGYGGSGRTFDWSLLEAYNGQTPFLLSGGIGPDSVEPLRQLSHPRWAGIDLNSGFETAPALKDPALLQSFINQINTSR